MTDVQFLEITVVILLTGVKRNEMTVTSESNDAIFNYFHGSPVAFAGV